MPSPRAHARLLLATVLATLAAGAALIGGASQAQARNHCGEGQFCMWEDPYAEGSLYVEEFVGGVGSFYDIHWWNGDNEISSVENNTNRSIRAWTNDNPTGRSMCWDPGEYNGELGDYDNDFESYVVVRSC